MKDWQKRAILLVASFVIFGLACFTALKVFNDNIVFFLSPTELQTRAHEVHNKTFRIGGIVKEGSVMKLDTTQWEFVVTDMQHDVAVKYNGVLPALFKEGQGVVILGTLGLNGEFNAIELLAKHDENYMPKEVADMLKQSGYWKNPNNKKPSPPYTDPDKPPYDIYGK